MFKTRKSTKTTRPELWKKKKKTTTRKVKKPRKMKKS